MNYTAAIADIRSAHRAQIEADLQAALQDRDAAQAALDLAAHRVCLLEGLLDIAAGPVEGEATPSVSPHDSAGTMTLHAAMHRVLKDSPSGKLRAGDIIAEIDRRRLYRMRDGRLPESQQIHARANHYPDMFGKDGSLFYAK
jgi:hypothetical protein